MECTESIWWQGAGCLGWRSVFQSMNTVGDKVVWGQIIECMAKQFGLLNFLVCLSLIFFKDSFF